MSKLEEYHRNTTEMIALRIKRLRMRQRSSYRKIADEILGTECQISGMDLVRWAGKELNEDIQRWDDEAFGGIRGSETTTQYP